MPESSSIVFNEPVEAVTHQTVSTNNKKIQVELRPPQRTRAHQTNFLTKSKFRSFATQTDPKITMLSSSNSVCTGTLSFTSPDSESDKSDYEEDEEEDSDDLYIPTEESDLEVEDDEDGEGEVHLSSIKLRQDVSPVEEKQFLVSETALAELLSVCRYCSAECTPTIKFVRGTFIYTSSKCLYDHEFTWSSQPCHNTLPWSNLFTATAILTSGCNATKVLQLFQNMNLQMFTPRTYNRLQAYYVVPSATRTWDFEQAELLEEIKEGPCQDVVVGGDARCDSPGYSAKYGTYTIMDLERNKILDFQLVQVNCQILVPNFHF